MATRTANRWAHAALHACRPVLLAAGLGWMGSAAAQFAMVPPALPPALQPSAAEAESAYRRDGAKHIYASYPLRIYKGRMPPMLYGVAIVDTELDAEGNVLNVQLTRPPAAPEVGPWIVQMIRKAAPFPAPTRLGPTVYRDIWLVHKGGNFQLDTLTEGQD